VLEPLLLLDGKRRPEMTGMLLLSVAAGPFGGGRQDSWQDSWQDSLQDS
jgi:hypothetical protein